MQCFPWEEYCWIKFSPSCYTYYCEFLCTLFKGASHWNLILRTRAGIQQSLKGVGNSIWVSLHSPIQNRLCVSKNKWSYHTRGLLSELSCWKLLPLLNTEKRGRRPWRMRRGGERGRRERIKGRKGANEGHLKGHCPCSHPSPLSAAPVQKRKTVSVQITISFAFFPSSPSLYPLSVSSFSLCLSFHLVLWDTEIWLPPLIKSSALSPTDTEDLNRDQQRLTSLPRASIGC